MRSDSHASLCAVQTHGPRSRSHHYLPLTFILRSRALSRALLSIFALLLLISTSTAQPSWLKEIIDASAQAKVDPDADAVFLYRGADATIKTSGEAELDVRIVVRVLKPGGVSHTYLTESVSGTRKIEGLEGWRIPARGDAVKLDKFMQAETALFGQAGYYDDVRQFTAAFADVRAGDVVGYKYKIKNKDRIGGHNEAFVFQVSQPVLLAEFSLAVPNGWEINHSGRFLEPVTLTEANGVYRWRAADLGLRESEPYMPSWSEVTRKIYVSCWDPNGERGRHFANWREAADWTWRCEENGLVTDPTLEDWTRTLCEGAATNSERVERVAGFVQRDIRYVAVEIDEGRFVPRAASMTYRNRYGDCKDKVSLVRAMLKVLGIETRAALANTDIPIDTLFPSPFQFNHVVLMIHDDLVPELAARGKASVDGWMCFDPTADWPQIGDLPSYLAGEQVLLGDTVEGRLVRLPSHTPDDMTRKYFVNATLGANLTLTADVRILDFGVRAKRQARHYERTTNKDLVDEYADILTESLTDVAISNLVTGFDNDSSWLTFSLAAGGAVDLAGDMYLLKLDFMHGDWETSRPKEVRQMPISFGSPERFATDVTWSLSEGKVFDLFADSGQTAFELGACRYRCQAEGATCTISSVVDYYGGTLPAEAIEQARAFTKELRASRQIRAVFRRLP